MKKKDFGKFRSVVNEDGTFSTKLCMGCAYHTKGMCSIANINTTFLTRCPDGYTMELYEEMQKDTIECYITGKHNSSYNFQYKCPSAPYPPRDGEDDDEYYDEEYLNA